MRLVSSHFRVIGVFSALVKNNHFILKFIVFFSGFYFSSWLCFVWIFFTLVVLFVKLSLQCSTHKPTRDHLGFPHLTLQ